MKFTPKTEKEIAESNLLPEGVYAFETIAADEKQSRSGNDMIVLKNAIYNQEGDRKLVVFDYLLESMAFKLLHYCQYTGLIEKYQSGELIAQDCIGKSGYCKIKTQKDKSGAYPDKSGIDDYIDPESMGSSDVPF